MWNDGRQTREWVRASKGLTRKLRQQIFFMLQTSRWRFCRMKKKKKKISYLSKFKRNPCLIHVTTFILYYYIFFFLCKRKTWKIVWDYGGKRITHARCLSNKNIYNIILYFSHLLSLWGDHSHTHFWIRMVIIWDMEICCCFSFHKYKYYFFVFCHLNKYNVRSFILQNFFIR